MKSIQTDMSVFREPLRVGAIQTAYRALLAYVIDLKRRFKAQYPGSFVSGVDNDA